MGLLQSWVREEMKKCVEGEQSWSMEKNGGRQGGQLVKRVAFSTCRTFCSRETVPFGVPAPPQHLVFLFCIKVRDKDTKVTWLLLLKSAVERSPGQLMMVYCRIKTAGFHRYVQSQPGHKQQPSNTSMATWGAKLLCCFFALETPPNHSWSLSLKPPLCKHNSAFLKRTHCPVDLTNEGC